MKNKWFLGFGVLVFFGLFFTACPTNGGSDDDPLTGTWKNTNFKLVAANGSFKQYTIPDSKEVVRGTYTYSGNTVTAIITQVNTAMFQGADEWFSYADLDATYKEIFGGETQHMTINGNTFTANGETFIKQQ